MATPVKKTRRIKLDLDKPEPPRKPKKALRAGVAIPLVVVVIVMLVVIGLYRKQQAQHTETATAIADTAFRPMIQQQIAREVLTYVQETEQFPANLSALPINNDANLSALVPNFRLLEIGFDRFAVTWLGPDSLDQITPGILANLQASLEPAWYDSGDDSVLLVFYGHPIALLPAGSFPPLPVQ